METTELRGRLSKIEADLENIKQILSVIFSDDETSELDEKNMQLTETMDQFSVQKRNNGL